MRKTEKGTSDTSPHTLRSLGTVHCDSDCTCGHPDIRHTLLSSLHNGWKPCLQKYQTDSEMYRSAQDLKNDLRTQRQTTKDIKVKYLFKFLFDCQTSKTRPVHVYLGSSWCSPPSLHQSKSYRWSDTVHIHPHLNRNQEKKKY